VSMAGIIVPTPSGGSKVMKRGEKVEGEYYEQVAARITGLVRESDMPKDLIARLEKERKQRTGESFPADLKKMRDGEDPEFDPKFDKPSGCAAENLSKVVSEERGRVALDNSKGRK